MSKRLADLGERKVIDMIRAQYGYSWPDDDAACIDSGKNYTLITTDAISQSSHIPKGADMKAVGYFFAALNLSDIAAMGGRPKYFMAAMTFTKNTTTEEVIGIEKGMKRCLDKFNVKFIGGDLKEGEEVNMTGTAIGEVSKRGILKRTGARNGDLICLTGSLGKNGAAYYMWKKSGAKRWANLLIEIEPRIVEGEMVSKYGASSAIDLSDGLFSATAQMSRISRHGFEIDYERLPINGLAKKVSRSLKIPIEDIVLNFGGEYELLFTISKAKFSRLQDAARKKRIKLQIIGRVSGKNPVLIRNGKRTPITKRGYEHFLR